jgi:hypothetical protein
MPMEQILEFQMLSSLPETGLFRCWHARQSHTAADEEQKSTFVVINFFHYPLEHSLCNVLQNTR